MILIFDTETNGLPRGDYIPKLVQLSLLFTEETGIERGFVNLIIKPDGWSIPKEAIAKHGITEEIAHKYGIPEAMALSIWHKYMKMSTMIVGHNVNFDMTIMKGAYNTVKNYTPSIQNFGSFDDIIKGKEINCTLEMCTPILKISPTRRMVEAGIRSEYKSPNLSECYKYFFNETFNAHNAGDDVRATARIFFHLLNSVDTTKSVDNASKDW